MEGTLESTPSEKITDLDQVKVWKDHSLIRELFFMPCLLTHMVVRLSLSTLTDLDSWNEMKSVWSPVDEPASQTAVPVAVHLCASDRWVVHSPLLRKRSLLFLTECQIARPWAHRDKTCGLLVTSERDIPDTYICHRHSPLMLQPLRHMKNILPLSKKGGDCGQKYTQVCEEKNTVFCGQMIAPTESECRELQEKEWEARMSPSWKWLQTALS